MAIKRHSEKLILASQNTPSPSPEKQKRTFRDLPREILDHAMIPALRDADTLSSLAQLDRSIHHANMRVTLSAHLTNIALAVKILEPKAEDHDGPAEAAATLSATNGASAASAAFCSLGRVERFVDLRAGALGPAHLELSSSTKLADAADIVRKNARLALDAGPSDPPPLPENDRLQLQLNVDFLQDKLLQVLAKQLEPWVAQETRAGGSARTARHYILDAIVTRSSYLALNGLGLHSLPPLHEYLPHLKSLNASGNQFVHVPINLKKLSQLHDLNMSNNALVSFQLDPAQLKGLRTINIRGNQLAQLDTNLWDCTELLRLDISHNAATSLPSDIGKLTELRELKVGDNAFVNLPIEFWQLTNLEVLEAPNNNLSSSTFQIYKLANLKHLQIQNNNALGSLPARIEELKRLEYLDAEGCSLTELPADMSGLTKLTNLHLSRNRLTNWSRSLHQLKKLQLLDLNHNPNLEPPEDLSAMGALLHLKLEGTCFKEFPLACCDLPRLRRLEITLGQFTSLHPQIGKLQNLVSLDLSQNKITKIPDEFGQLKSLDFLNLSKNPIVGFPETFGQLESLETVFLNDTNLSRIPDSFCELKSLSVLHCFDSRSPKREVVMPTRLLRRGGLTIGRSLDLD